jgi:hypothetical protein
VTDDDPADPVIAVRAHWRWPGRLGALFPSDPAVAAVLRITAAALVVTVLFWVFR